MSLCENCKSLDLCTAVKNNKGACFFFSPTEKYRIENSKEYAIGYEQGGADALDEVLNILISDGDYGHETFSLTYLKGLLKQLKEQSNS